MKKITAFVAPHRIGFLLGCVLLLLSLGWWTVEMLARVRGAALGMILPAMLLHGYLMLFGFFPLFMLGFIYTAGPRWLRVAAPTLRVYVPVMVGYGFGTLLVLGGGWVSAALPFGITLHAISWAAAVLVWIGRIRASDVPDKRHAHLIAAAFILGLLAQLMAIAWSAGYGAGVWQAAVHLGVWGFLLPVFLIVSHRMVPFFSGNVLAPYVVWNPPVLLLALVGFAWMHGALAMLGVATWPIDALFAAVLAYTVWRWGLVPSFKVPLLAMLHASLAWSAVSLALFSLQGLFEAQGRYVLGFAPLHALTIGFFTTMLLGFVTRVSLGHSGRPLVASRFTWSLYWLMHGVAVTRVAADVVPGWQQPLYVASAVIALAAFVAWGTRFVPIYVRPREDGKEG